MNKLVCATATVLIAWCTTASGQMLHLAPDSRTDVSLTVYSDFAVVRDVRRTTLPAGSVELEFEGVARMVDPASVSVRSLGPGDAIEVQRQSYQYDLLNKRSLLERYIGRKLKYSLSLTNNNTIEKVFREGVLLSIEPEIVQFGDSIEIAPDGVISLPYVPEGLKTTPTLVWQLNNPRRGPRELETTYVSGGLGWSADYTLVLDQSERRFDLSSWVNLTNESGASFEGASLQLVAGQVNRTQSVQPKMMAMMSRAADMESGNASRSTMADYHLYDFPGTFDLDDHETLQLRFRSATDVPISKQYISTSNVPMHQMRESQSERFDVVYRFDAEAAGREPLPAGRVRVMKKDGSGNLQLIGEDRIGHTPVQEDVAVTVGKAFDLKVERTQASWRRLGDRTSEVTVEVTVTNSKDEPVHVTLHEKFFGDWEVVSQTRSGDKVDSTTLAYDLSLRGGESSTLTYTVRSGY